MRIDFSWTIIALLIGAPLGSRAESPVWFNHGIESIDSGTTSDRSATACRSCHQEIYQDWSRSRHAQSWTNPIFQEGFRSERADRCIYCHAPLREQFAEIKGAGTANLAAEGVNCATCHIRAGRVYSSTRQGQDFHPVYREARLKDPLFCAGCHQFNFLKHSQGRRVSGTLPAQNTYREWLSYQTLGGTKTCQDCHMPNGQHVFHGAHQDQFLKAAVSLSAVKRSNGYEFTLTAKDIGHRLPTGDMFRNITLEVASGDSGAFRIVRRFGRVFKIVSDPATGSSTPELQSDTSFAPFESKTVKVEIQGPIRYRLVYHYTSPTNELRSLLHPSELTDTIAEGRGQ